RGEAVGGRARMEGYGEGEGRDREAGRVHADQVRGPGATGPASLPERGGDSHHARCLSLCRVAPGREPGATETAADQSGQTRNTGPAAAKREGREADRSDKKRSPTRRAESNSGAVA